MKILWNTVLTTGLAVALIGCAGMTKSSSTPTTTQAMKSDQSVPGAQGMVKAEETDNGNTRVEVEVAHLARPGALKGDANVYVVWAREAQSDSPVKLGALRVDDDLTGELETVTPMREFDVFITPEDSIAVNKPSNKRLLTAYVSMD